MVRRRAESNSYPASEQSRPYSKRRKHYDHDPSDGILTPEVDETTLKRSTYTIAWICALHIELAAAQAMLDAEHDELPGLADDDNTYILGNVGKHNVVIACLPTSQYGTNNAASIVTDMKRTFPAIRVGLMVGIGGAAPAMADIRLGDVVVGTRVMQYDLGKILSDDEFEYTAIPKIPQRLLGTVVSTLRSKHELRPSNIPAILDDKLEDNKRYSRPQSPDWLFHASYCHEDSRAFCETCDQTKLVLRPARSNTDPEIHYGAIASGNQVMRDAIKRDKIARDLNIICFEMEAAGLMDSLPCLPIRGICDYSDSHKNKKWQRYAAATAAAYAKELLDVMPSAGSEKTTAIRTPKPDGNSLLEGLLSKEDEVSPLQRRRRLIKALEFEQIHSRKAAIMETHSDTCRWFLEHEAYQSWSDPSQVSKHHGFLWINGKPGAGKSTLMKFLYTESRKLSQKNLSATSSFFFNARGEKLEKSIAGMYRSLLAQLLNSFEDIQEVLDEMDLEPDHLIDWPLGTLKDLLRNAIFRLNERQLTCFIDALDECDEQQIVEMVHYFETLAEHCAGAAIPLKICFSSRHYPYIHIEKGMKLTLEDQEGHSEDLAAYVEGRLRVKGDALGELQSQILNKAAGVFLWVVLVVDILNKEERRGRLAMKRRLTELPSRLTDLFRDMVARDQEYMEDLLLSILWILYAKRPLTPAEYYHALWIGLQEKCHADPELPGVDDLDSIQRYVVSSSKGLAETTKVEPQRVQFIHESVRDFLLKDKGIAEIWPELGHDWETLAHERLKDCCYRYMSNPRSYRVGISAGVFFGYARDYVLAHANGAAKSVPQHRFLSRFPLLIYCRGYRYRHDTDLLYILADQGLSNLITHRLEDFPRIETRGNSYRFPLFAAIKNHHADTVVALLASGMDLSEATDISKNLIYGQDYSKNFTMLTWAIDAGHIAIISLCLSKGSFANEEDPRGYSPLGMAVRRNNPEIVQLLLDNGAKPQNCGPQVLIDAVQSQNIEIVRALLDHGCDPNKSDGYYRPLKVAHNRQNDEMVQLLVAYGANPWFT